ncbi:MAG: Uma2 family endonuclease [Rhodomicrobium sp.]
MSNSAQAWPAHTMTADEFLAWAETYEGEEKLELIDGRIVPKYTAMAPETLKHHNVKVAVFDALRLAIKQGALPCEVLIDSLAVRISESKTFIPDVAVRCGAALNQQQREIPDPLIVVEILSPSTKNFDFSGKLQGYFQVPSVEHYVVIDPDKPLAIHFTRANQSTLTAALASAGALKLDPPGVDLDLSAIFG